jgi:hypothetical protein
VIEANQLLARAFGNQSDTEAQLLGDGADGRLGMLSGQDARGTVTANVNNSTLNAEISTVDDATGSSLSASDNQLEAAVTVNQARAVFADNVSAELVEQLASDTTALSTVRLNSGDFDGQLVDVVGGSSVVANSQVIRDGALASSATVNDSTIAVDLREGGNISDGAESALSVDGNNLRATLTGNTAVVGTDLSVDTLFQGSAAVLNQQQIGDGSAPIALSATVDRSALTVDLGETTESSVSVSDNRIGASTSGFVGRNGTGAGTFLIVDANQIDAAGGEASVSFATDDQLNLSGSFVLGTQQVIAGDDGATSSISAQALGSGLTVLSQDVLNSALNVTANTLFATAGGNEEASEIRITGTSIDASAALGNEQRVTDTSITATLGNAGAQTELSATVEGAVSGSSIAVDGNLMLAQAEANVGQNLLSVDSDTVLTRVSPANRALLESNDNVTRGGFVLSGVQEFSGEDAALSASADSALSVTVGEGAAGAIAGSSVSIADNTQMVMAEANQIANALELSAVSLGEGPNAATSILSNRQNVDVDSITATSAFTARLSQGTLAAGAARIADSSLAVDGNENRAVVMGNEAINRLSLSADTGIVGDLVNESRANLSGNFSIRATSVLANEQSLEATAGLTATATTDAQLLSQSATSVGTVSSSLSVSDNLTVATVTGNSATSGIDQTAGAESGATAALRNLQDVNADATATADGTFRLNIRGNVQDTSLAMDRNRLFSSVTANTARNTIEAAATTFDTPTDSISYNAGFTSAADGQARADFAILSDQAQTGDLTARTALGADLLVQPAGSQPGNFTGTSASIDDTLARADALANQAANRIAATADADAENVTAAIASRQDSEGEITAEVASVATGADRNDFRLQTRGGLTESSMSIDGTTFIASAGANTVTNQLSLEAVSLTGASLQDDFDDLGARLNLGNDFVLARSDANIGNLQISDSIVAASAEFTARMTTLSGGLLGSSASVSDSVIQAQASGNRANNLAELAGDASVTGTAAIANAQISTGDISAESDMFQSIGVGISLNVTGPVLDASSLALDDNIGLASASGNIATSVLQVAATSIDGISNTTNVADIAVPDSGTGNVRARADFAVASQQSAEGSVTAETAIQLRPGVRGDISASAVSISGNIGQAVANANQTSSVVDLVASADVSGTAAVVNDQSGSGEVAADSDLVLVQRQDLSAVNPEPQITASAITLDDNLSISVARGNDAANTVSLAGASVSGRDNATDVTATAAGTLTGTGDALLANTQSRTGGQGVTSSASIRADALLLSDDGTNSNTIVATPSSLTDSSVSISGNFADSTSSANRARNTLALNADTGVSAGGGIVSTQSSDSTVSSDVRITARVGSDDFGGISGSSVVLNSNIGVARASGNDATSRLTVQSGTGVAGQSTLGGSASLNGTTGVLNAAADFAMATNQVNTGSVTASAGNTIGDRSLISATTSGGLLNSSVSVSNNALVADATSNRADNRMTVSGRPASENVTVAMANRQVATGPVTAQVNSGRLASASGAVTSSAVRLSGNQFSAGATGNVATTRLTRD